MMNSDVRKPPVAPKPKMVQSQRPGLSPAMPKREGLALPSPGTQRKAKPALAPKPCLHKLTSDAEAKSLASKSLQQPPATERPRTVGLLSSPNGIQQENKRPDWDYIIPICLCSKNNCNCIARTSTHADKMEKELKTLYRSKAAEGRNPLPASHMDHKDKRTDNARSQVVSSSPPQTVCLQATSTNTQPSNQKHLKAKPTLDINSNADKVRPPFPSRTLSDEQNGNLLPLSAPGQEEAHEALDSGHMHRVPKPTPVPRKHVPAPESRKLRAPALAHQEEVEDEKEESVGRKGREMKVGDIKMSSGGKSSAPQPVTVPANENKQPAFAFARPTCAPPAPPPEKKPFLSAPTLTPQDVVEEDLGWDSNTFEMELSVDEEGKELVKKQRKDQEAVYYNLTPHPVPGNTLTQPKPGKPPGRPPVKTVAAGEHRAGKVTQKKPQRPSSPTTRMQKKESAEEKEEHNENRPVPPSQNRVMKELPHPPGEKKGSKSKSSRSSLGKKAKSFSGADVKHSKGHRKNSFRKLLELKLTVKQRTAKDAEALDSPESEKNGKRLYKDPEEHQDLAENLRGERKLSAPLVGVEQSVDDDDKGVHYENIAPYEDIPVYVNVQVGKTRSPPGESLSQPTARHGEDMYNDEGIYEEQEPYVPFVKTTEQHRHGTDYDRNPVTGEVPPLDESPSDDNITFNSSDEEFDGDSSSISSKGESEQPEGSTTQNVQKKSKVHYIAKEIMTSENVFVDVLKLLHVDFREAVFEASRESGKPVIEERLLNQILYYLPQLYELNKDLLRELQQRLAEWDEDSQVADVFLKKGPYLKMYSTYIREYDKNVALLEEQTKKNPAFGAVVQEFEATPQCANLALKHYLLKPIQRIPQYQLLLTDYLKNLSEDSADYKDTQAALALVKEVANHANDIMKQGDDFQKVIRVQDSLTGNKEIVQPGRNLLKEGLLMKLSRKIMQPRMFFLFNDVLLYTTPVQSGQYKLNNMLSLSGMKVSKPSQEAYQNELNIVSVERSFILSASSAPERDEWLEAISTAITDYTKKMISFVSGKPLEEVELTDCTDSAPLGSKAPIWIPDLRATMCMICTCEFTITWRRHHCRACGKVVCHSCSTNKHALEYRKNELVRVCDKCFDILLEQSNERSPAETISPGNRATFAFQRRQKKIPAALKEVSANTDNSSISGYLQRSKGNKKQAKRLWFVIKNKVLYTYAASEDVAALESQPLLGFVLKADSPQKLKFKLYHKNTLYYNFKADDVETAQRWINAFKEETVL